MALIPENKSDIQLSFGELKDFPIISIWNKSETKGDDPVLN
jgi:hypothetical protein